jgi:hypothetical protein
VSERRYLDEPGINVCLIALLMKKDLNVMANNNSLKKLVTKIKNKIINYLHVADLKQLVEISKFIGIRINNSDLERLEEKIKK